MENSYTFQSPIGRLTICEQNNQLTRLYLNNQDGGSLNGQSLERHSDFLYEAYRQLNEYFAGKRKAFELPVNGQGTEFQKAVRAIGQANGRNPIMIVVPCHRVIRKNGDISGFACGVEAKRYLLNLERENSINRSWKSV